MEANCLKCEGLMSFSVGKNGQPQQMGVIKFKDSHFNGAYICECCYNDYCEQRKPFFLKYGIGAGTMYKLTLKDFCKKNNISDNKYKWSAKMKELWAKKHEALWRLFFIANIRFDNLWRAGEINAAPISRFKKIMQLIKI